MEAIERHRESADDLRAALLGGGVTDAALRAAVAARASGGPAVEEPYDALTHQIGEAAHRVTDAQVTAVRDAAGSDKAAFEIVLSACIGAGLARWDAAARAIEGAGDAAS